MNSCDLLCLSTFSHYLRNMLRYQCDHLSLHRHTSQRELLGLPNKRKSYIMSIFTISEYIS
jgi:hypothetical protein